MPLALGVTGVALIALWFAAWSYGGPVPTRGHEVEFDDALGFAAGLVAGIAALALAAVPALRRHWAAWIALGMLGAATIGGVIALIDYDSSADFDVGAQLTPFGGAILIGLAALDLLTRPTRDAPRFTPFDVAAALGCALMLVGLGRYHDTLTWVAETPTTIVALGGIAVLGAAALIQRPNVGRAAAVVCTFVAGFALTSAGMVEVSGRPWLVLGCVIAAAGGIAAYARRTSATS